jgi:hypothetical protein
MDLASPTDTATTRPSSEASAAAARLAAVGAVLGDSFSLQDLCDVVGESAGALLTDLQELLDAGTLVAGDDGLRFPRTEVRDGIYDGLPATVRLALHHQVGTLFITRGDASGGGRHLALAAQRGDRVLLAALDAAAGDAPPAVPWTCAHELSS